MFSSGSSSAYICLIQSVSKGFIGLEFFEFIFSQTRGLQLIQLASFSVLLSGIGCIGKPSSLFLCNLLINIVIVIVGIGSGVITILGKAIFSLGNGFEDNVFYPGDFNS